MISGTEQQVAKRVEATAGTRPLRAAIICNFLEEQWRSMDLVGDMLCRFLSEEGQGRIAASQIRPTLRRRFMRWPTLPTGTAWNMDRLINRFADYPRFLRGIRNGFDLFHIVDHSYSQLVHDLPAERTVVTCHDLDTFRCLLEPELDPRPRWFRAMMQRSLDGFKKAAHVIAVSEATRRALVQHRIVPADRISVVPNGVHPACSPNSNDIADAEAVRLLPKRSPDVVWLLHVGTAIRRKRIDILLRILASIRKQFPEVRLARVGGEFTVEQQQMVRELCLENAITVLPYLKEETLAAVYRRATLLLNPTEAEGFGLPLVEAMACGCRVVASDLPVLREVGGTAITYCPVADIDAWTEAVNRHLIERAQEDVWQTRRRQAIARAAQFSWADNAIQTAAIYHNVMSK